MFKQKQDKKSVKTFKGIKSIQHNSENSIGNEKEDYMSEYVSEYASKKKPKKKMPKDEIVFDKKYKY